uniref:Uncharacterized protein n=1 Tax=Anopheles albimanus TaxID=7167 RepID=A0A182FIB8_ANOAL
MTSVAGSGTPTALESAVAQEEGDREVSASGSTPSSTGELGSRPAPRNAAEETAVLAGELYAFVKPKNNVHGQVKEMATKMKVLARRGVNEHEQLRMRVEMAEKALSEAAAREKALEERVAAVEAALAEAMKPTPATNVATPKARVEKRRRETPGKEEENKKPRGPPQEGGDAEDEGGWQHVPERPPKGQRKPRVQAQPKAEEAGKLHPAAHPRGDAIRVGVTAGTTYADLLKKVTSAPELAGMAKDVVRMRTTQKGDMLIELRPGAAVPTKELRSLVQESLGQEAAVRALTQDATIECRNLDSLTTEEEMKRILQEQCGVDVVSYLHLRRGPDSTKTATIRVNMQGARKLLERRTIKLPELKALVATEPQNADELVDALVKACDKAMPRSREPREHHRPAYWWNETLDFLRAACLRARRLVQRAKTEEDREGKRVVFRVARSAFRRELQRSKSACFKELCAAADDNPWGDAYRIVMAKVSGSAAASVRK